MAETWEEILGVSGAVGYLTKPQKFKIEKNDQKNHGEWHNDKCHERQVAGYTSARTHTHARAPVVPHTFPVTHSSASCYSHISGRTRSAHAVTFVEEALEVVEDAAEVGQTAHQLLVVHELHEIVWARLRLLLRFHFPHHIPRNHSWSPRVHRKTKQVSV